MARTIFKYPAPMPGVTYPGPVLMPRGAQIVHVAMQGHQIMLWALVDKDAPLEDRHFVTVGTGWPLDVVGGNLKHVGTVLHGELVWHVVEVLV